MRPEDGDINGQHTKPNPMPDFVLDDEEGDLCEVSDSDQDDIGAMQIPQTGILGVLAVHTISGAVLGSTHSITG
ncbi:unnamed protein product [Penicillium roqueforti FM164]|uniref:Genomic scaffold, ProqFM164S03 n=1 Tax=Penicillium roqueforti (strain FM164) TaxID=1365484 RepID=W6QV26_PENRF|nr:unnamed protein product [Penicillium roqueforti FM164]